jgi:hypothetical protein
VSRQGAYLILLVCDHPDCPSSGESFPYSGADEAQAIEAARRDGWRIRAADRADDRCPACRGAVRDEVSP